MNSTLIALAASLALAGASFIAGQHVQANVDKAAQLDAAVLDAEIARHANHAALGAGLRTEQAQLTTDGVHQKIRSDYEIEQRKNPAIGCVLDPVSLRIWNAANTQSDPAAASEPAGEVRGSAGAGTDGQRGEQSPGIGAHVSPVPQ